MLGSRLSSVSLRLRGGGGRSLSVLEYLFLGESSPSAEEDEEERRRLDPVEVLRREEELWRPSSPLSRAEEDRDLFWASA